MGCFINSCQCQPIHPSLVLEGQSRVYQSRCVLVSSISLLVLACPAKCGHCAAFPLSIHHATTLLLTPTYTAPHCTPHYTVSQKTRHTTTPVCCCVSCLCVAVFVCHCLPADSTLNQTTQHHGNRQSPHMGQPMDDTMSEWEGTVVCVDTTAQTQGTRRK